ncbi:bifunctional phosphoribosyl-AMP cyclohydrolase/phosphoribosyl-ATP diphosphatase HisIE [Paraferrimonas haliotis]|uniref:Histidine biosynthesis bifunctional protein HisIE n=1 Tax=Paraferrimonas haliotis TaxID=2013866 RepID=A0AA37TNL6_9GAMM|nr:bifunctional phosphoribosyl-AMP cyclohydrolase/phosphoribosyl-ATP diphosphatase HisIE [Paraferrimonas haliotis]GLS84757.1 histidine biosynthesis bifunctional protein HisIE [Paraferrimonas haliotis]
MTAHTMPTWVNDIDWNKVEQLLPVVIQHYLNGQVLMLGYMSPDALQQTLTTNKVTFYSRTKQRLWVKGETSGHYLMVDSLCLDCDNDTLLIQARPEGPTCHLGTVSCFNQIDAQSFLGQLENVISQRKANASDGSYTASLFARGTKRIAQKVGEEGVEVALAAVTQDRQNLIDESSDLLYHLLVVLQDQDVSLDEVLSNLYARHQS